MKQYDILVVLYSLQKLMEKGEYEAAKDLINKIVNLHEKESK